MLAADDAAQVVAAGEGTFCSAVSTEIIFLERARDSMNLQNRKR